MSINTATDADVPAIAALRTAIAEETKRGPTTTACASDAKKFAAWD